MKARADSLNLNGWLIIDKPLGLTSTQVVGKVRRITRAAKLGHAGTLDPLASGILPLALGEATKTIQWVMDGRKIYRFAIGWGEARDTDDCEGKIIGTSPVRPGRDAILAALPVFLGTILQTPPIFSAIKQGGQRAYDLARAGQEVVLESREVRIDRLELLDALPDRAEFEMECGKGTYVRALARDLAGALGTLGHVVSLRRIRCGPFDEAVAISLDMLESLGHSAAAAQTLLPVATALVDIPALAVTGEEANRISCGQAIAWRGVSDTPAQPPRGAILKAVGPERVVALVRIEAGLVYPVRVLNL